jgi:hypothetical protein
MDGLTIAQRLGRGKIRESRSRSFGTKVTLSEERELVEAAENEGKTASEWAREVLLREARRSDDDALFTELVGMRMLMVNLFKPLVIGKPVAPEWVTEVMAAVRKEKRKAAQEVRQQYADDKVGGQ